MLSATCLSADMDGPRVAHRLEDFFKSFLAELVIQKVDEVQLQRAKARSPVNVTTDKWTAKACQRASRCFGLPEDGHCVHSIHQGRLRCYCPGPGGELDVGLFEGCESKWDLAAHRCGIWLVGTSSPGKDNALATHRWITNRIASELQLSHPHCAFVCFNKLDVGRRTYSGLLAQLEEGRAHEGEV
jgi:hypothetical protein